ncbi:hypothetical protein [Candidatus Entotheonella palauensis]|uniref:Uncharacterized protein n=1 Tax=Candidatus Entotheonella gemina TaxID=1429439 RepID=W4L850_9BACT|nr:hypothetical protein [Candidatus Entotheonella palauensis]ETW93835.1 MAG: hypothetical protein ETSY2_50730 [Candidatus Entotheonella gemina]
MSEESKSSRGPILTLLAICMGLLAISNFSKPITQMLAPEGNAGFVFFGTRLHGLANAIVGPLFGVCLAIYAYGAWTLKKWAVPIAVAYALYVIANVILFVRNLPPDQGGNVFGWVYVVLAVGISSGGAWYLWRHRDWLS